MLNNIHNKLLITRTARLPRRSWYLQSDKRVGSAEHRGQHWSPATSFLVSEVRQEGWFRGAQGTVLVE
ncbi:hypothetical protein RRG08_054845 [Elysia crispata]|uniref:Uncharacterized protein n=1 Tax=Elysia crispata TaxID=231223 RepID=A0AAE1A6E6_9GAST|nr:hypothetical protein RRG08_054845 [Elysia crispata]